MKKYIGYILIFICVVFISALGYQEFANLRITNNVQLRTLLFDSVNNQLSYSMGRLYFDSDKDYLTFMNTESDISLQIGGELYRRVHNSSGSDILNGQVVYVKQANGSLPRIFLANAKTDTTYCVLGMATHDIENGSNGFITLIGDVGGLNTNAILEGSTIYLDTVNGGWTVNKYKYPYHLVELGIVTYKHQNQGIIALNINEKLNGSFNTGNILYANGNGRIAEDNGFLTFISKIFKIGDNTNYVSLDTINGLMLNGYATCWDDLTVSGINFAGGVNAPTIRDLGGNVFAAGYNFQTANDISYLSLQMSHQYDTGTDTRPHIHYAIETNGGVNDSVLLRITGSWTNIHDTINATNLISDTLSLSLNGKVGKVIYIWDLPYLDGTGKGISSQFIYTIERLQNITTRDTYNNWFYILDFDIHYQINKLGSRNEFY